MLSVRAQLVLITAVLLACLASGASSDTLSAQPQIVYYVHASSNAIWSVPASGGTPAPVPALSNIKGGIQDIAVSPDGTKMAVITISATDGPSNLRLTPAQSESAPVGGVSAYLQTTVDKLTLYDLTGQSQPVVLLSQTNKCIIPNERGISPVCVVNPWFDGLHWNHSSTLITYDYSGFKKLVTIDHIRVDPENVRAGKANTGPFVLLWTNAVSNLKGGIVRRQLLTGDKAGQGAYVSDTSYDAYAATDGDGATAGSKLLLGRIGHKMKVLVANPHCFAPGALAISPDDTSVAFVGWPAPPVIVGNVGGVSAHECSPSTGGTDVAVASPSGVRVIAKSTVKSEWQWDQPIWLSDGSGLLLIRDNDYAPHGDVPHDFQIWISRHDGAPKLLATDAVNGDVTAGPSPPAS
jgi:hypothetical protein